MPVENYVDWMKACYLISILETPSISVPCGFTPEGLPVGLQIVGNYFDETRMLAAAHAYQQATDWHTRVPPGFE